MAETKGTLELSSDEAVLLVRSLHCLLNSLEAARHSFAVNIDTAIEEREAVISLERRVKRCWELDWSRQGWAFGR